MGNMHDVFNDVHSQIMEIDERQYRQVNISIFKTYDSRFLQINQLKKPISLYHCVSSFQFTLLPPCNMSATFCCLSDLLAG